MKRSERFLLVKLKGHPELNSYKQLLSKWLDEFVELEHQIEERSPKYIRGFMNGKDKEAMY